MNVLFVHQNFPGQFRHMATALAADRANRVAALCINEPGYPTPGVTIARYRPARSASKEIHPLAANFEAKVIRGEGAVAGALELKRRGFDPDLIVGHPGWGEMLFVNEVWPEARTLHFLEFFYRTRGLDYDFDPEFRDLSLAGRMRLAANGSHLLASLEAMSRGYTPTLWQKSSLPPAFHDKVDVIFDGIDTGFIAPDPETRLELPDGRPLRAGDEVLTFVNRNLEPYRGFHVFMRALPAIQKARPEAVTLIVGGDSVSYGLRPRDAENWREALLREVGDRLDLGRIRFLGRIPYPTYRQLLRISRVHAYLTYPFVLSWSMMEAMAAECLVIGSKTPPVQEVLRHGENGLLVDFFDVDGWSREISQALANPAAHLDLRRQARADIVARYDLRTVCLPEQLALLKRVAAL